MTPPLPALPARVRSPPPPSARASPTPSSPASATPIGRLLVVQGPAGVVRVGFHEERRGRAARRGRRRLGPRVVASDAELAATPRRAVGLPRGRQRRGSTLPVDLRLVHSPFRRAVLETLHARRAARRGRHLRRARRARRPAAGRPRRRAPPAPATRSRSSSLPPRPAGRGRRRQLRRRAGAQARAAGARGRAVRSRTGRSRSCVDHDRLDGLLVGGVGGHGADRVDDVLALGHLAEQRVVGRQLGVLAGDDEELAARRARGLGARVLAIATTPCVYARSLGGASTTE